MATLLIRNLDDAVRDKLRVRAAEHGRSMEAEAREILAAGVVREAISESSADSGADLWERLRNVFSDVGGVDLPEFPAEPYAPRAVWDDPERETKE
jgi:plasmid stability protein